MSAALGTKKGKKKWKKTEVDENGNAVRKRGRPRKTDEQKIRDKTIREAKKAAEHSFLIVTSENCECSDLTIKNPTP